MHWISHTLLLSSLATAAIWDHRNGSIPDAISYFGIASGLLLPCFTPAGGFENALRDMLLVSGGMFWLAMSFESLTHREGMGFGDIKLSGVLGAFLGIGGAIRVITYAAWLAILHRAFGKNSSRHRQIPFAPYIFCGAMVYEICSLFTARPR
jgi:leader peptidase (prepilin peptidase)/N-methyltransferase